MLALSLMLSRTYYAQNYAGIIGLGLTTENSYFHKTNSGVLINSFAENLFSFLSKPKSQSFSLAVTIKFNKL